MGLWLLGACTAANGAFDSGSTGETSEAMAEVSTDTAITTSDAERSTTLGGPVGSSTGPDSSTDPDSGTGPDACQSPPIRPHDYPGCNDGTCDGADCIQVEPTGPVEFGMSVCATSCVDDCDCPAPPDGRAQPRCERGRCMLSCADGRSCPGSLVCTDGMCLRISAYGPCDDSCLSGFCFGFGDENGRFTDWVCPAVDCMEGGVPNDALCPPPPAGNAVPRCFEPQFPVDLQGTGWCVITCEGGETCPEGMSCVQGDCVHPA